MSADPKKMAALIVAGMPSPDKLRKGPPDEGESADEAASEEDTGKMGGEAHLEAFKKALDGGDMAAAWDAFTDAVQACKGSDYTPKN